MIKSYLIISSILLFILSTPVYATNDKTFHFAVSTVTGYLAETIIHKQTDSDFKRVAYGALLGTVPGLIKEIADSNEENKEFSQDDMLANIAGAFVGSYFSNKVNKRLMVNLKKDKDAYIVGLVLWD